MASIEFRSEGTYYDESHKRDEGQPTLPLDFPTLREVHWLHAERVVTRRFIGKKVITKLVADEGSILPKRTFIDVDAIAELKDPDLRYALRFADAAQAVGWTSDGPGMLSSHDVIIEAHDAGVDSQLIHATYTGIGREENDTFLQNLKQAAPSHIQ